MDKIASRPLYDEENSDDRREISSDYRRKNIINLRDKLMPHRSISNENIPRKLLIELASLASSKFKIEVKSKCESIVLPGSHPQPPSRTISSQNVVKFDIDQDEPATNNSKVPASKALSPLENYYAVLKCTIVNKSLALVPPIRVFIPYNYPDSNPLVECLQLDEFDDDMLPEYSMSINLDISYRLKDVTINKNLLFRYDWNLTPN